MMDVRKRKFHGIALEHSKRMSVEQRFLFNLGDTTYPFVCRRTKPPGRDARSEKVRETGRR